MKIAEISSKRLDSLVANCNELGIVKNTEDLEKVIYNALAEHKRNVLSSRPQVVEGQLSLLDAM